MLDFLIRGMEMPENCFDCPFGEDVDVGVGVAHGCSILKDFAQYANERHRDCPLVEIQTPHGDLIDSDSVVNAQFYTETIDALLGDVNDALALVRERETRINELAARSKELESAVPHWISVEERLPNYGEIILCYNRKTDQYELGSRHGDRTMYLFGYGMVDMGDRDFPTHWMPLPEPPKEDAECKN